MEALLHSVAKDLFSLFCHQNPDLLLRVGGEPLPICTRCGCIYVGVFLTWAVASLFRRHTIPWSVGMALVAILVVEWLTANLGLRAASEVSRALAGLAGGAGAVIVLLPYSRIIGRRIITSAGLVLVGTAITTTIHTAALLLILCSFVLFWANAGWVALQIISTSGKKEKYDENQSLDERSDHPRDPGRSSPGVLCHYPPGAKNP
ncbi:MAG: DUF2085 domain-containing protein [Candidatus Neomarinimicrobiota bacterium]